MWERFEVGISRLRGPLLRQVETQFLTLRRSDELLKLQRKESVAENRWMRLRSRSGNHAVSDCGICARQTRTTRRQTFTGWERSRACGEWAWSRVQHHTALGIDRNESRHFTVSATRLTYGSGVGRACPVAEIR